MYGLSLGVQRMGDVLPSPVYALLSGLNASTVGIIALAAVQLADKAIKDKVTRILVFFGACAGLCYNALWYFPVLMVIGGLTTIIWDGFLHQRIARFRARRRRQSSPEGFAENSAESSSIPLESNPTASIVTHRKPTAASSSQPADTQSASSARSHHDAPAEEAKPEHSIKIRVGIPIVVAFFGKPESRSSRW